MPACLPACQQAASRPARQSFNTDPRVLCRCKVPLRCSQSHRSQHKARVAPALSGEAPLLQPTPSFRLLPFLSGHLRPTSFQLGPSNPTRDTTQQTPPPATHSCSSIETLQQALRLTHHSYNRLPTPTTIKHTHSLLTIMSQDYAALKVPELKKLLTERGLPQTGNKADLVGRLQDNDKSTFQPLRDHHAHHRAPNPTPIANATAPPSTSTAPACDLPLLPRKKADNTCPCK